MTTPSPAAHHRAMRTRVVTIDSRYLTPEDRDVLQAYAEQEVGTHGDIHLEATKAQMRNLNELLDILVPDPQPQ